MQLLLIQFVFVFCLTEAKDFIYNQDKQSFIKFTPNNCYFYDGNSMIIEDDNGKPKIKYFKNEDCSGTSNSSLSLTSKLQILMNNCQQKLEYIDTPKFFITMSISSKYRCGNKEKFITQYYNDGCVDLDFSSKKLSIVNDWIISSTYVDQFCRQTIEKIPLYKCNTCTNNKYFTCGSKSLFVFFGTILFFIFF